MINDAAFVAYELANSLRKRGYQVRHKRRSRNIFGKLFSPLINSIGNGSGITHVHYALQDAYLVSKLGNLDILHCHGSDVRKTIDSRYGWMVKSSLKKAKKILYATPDMEEKIKEYREDAEYFATPINTETFHYHPPRHNGKPVAYYKMLGYEEMPSEVESTLKRNGFDIMRFGNGACAYVQMPNFLSSADIFVDRFSINSLSKTALEACSVGRPTVDYHHADRIGERIEFLSDQKNREIEGKKAREYILRSHNLEKLTDKLLEVYSNVVGGHEH